MQRDVDGHLCPHRIEPADRVAAIGHGSAGAGYPKHQILTGRIEKATEVRGRHDHAQQARSELTSLNHLEVPQAGVG